MANEREDAFKRLLDLFDERGYRRTLSRRIIGEADNGYSAVLDVYVDGKAVLVERFWDDDEFVGFEVFVPVTSSSKVDDTIDALREFMDAP